MDTSEINTPAHSKAPPEIVEQKNTDPGPSKLYSIYMITNIINGKKYIGVTSKSIDQRFQRHIKQSKGESCRMLYHAFNKYGIENFVVSLLDTATDPNYAYEVLEPKYILEHNTYFKNDCGYNMTLGGEGNIEKYLTSDSRKRMATMKGKVMPESTKQKISAANKGRPKSEITKQKMSIDLSLFPFGIIG